MLTGFSVNTVNTFTQTSRLCWTDYGATEDEMMDFGKIYLFMLERFGYGP